MALSGGTVICPNCKREVGARPNRHEPTLGIPYKHNTAQGAPCEGLGTDGEDWVRWPTPTRAGSVSRDR